MAQPTQPERRRATRIITENELLDAAVALVDAEGLAALSMRRLAVAAGVAPMTIYGFFENKEALLTQLAAHVLRELPVSLDADRPWRDRVHHELTSLRASFQHHVGLLDLLSVGDVTPVLDSLRERLIGMLRDSGADDQTVLEGLGGLAALTLGFLVANRIRQIGIHDDSYARLNGLSSDSFPNLTSMAGLYASHWSDNAFEYGVNALLDAIEAAAPTA